MWAQINAKGIWACSRNWYFLYGSKLPQKAFRPVVAIGILYMGLNYRNFALVSLKNLARACRPQYFGFAADVAIAAAANPRVDIQSNVGSTPVIAVACKRRVHALPIMRTAET